MATQVGWARHWGYFPGEGKDSAGAGRAAVERASEWGDTLAAALCEQEGWDGKEANPEKSVAVFKRLADGDGVCGGSAGGGAGGAQEYAGVMPASDPFAANALASAYSRGTGVGTDLNQAVHWLRRAAASGHLQASVSLALMWRTGRGGLPVDHSKSVAMLTKASDQELAWAQYHLSTAYEKGQGVSPDANDALFDTTIVQVNISSDPFPNITISNVHFKNLIADMEVWLNSSSTTLTLNNVFFENCKTLHTMTPGIIQIIGCKWFSSTTRAIHLEHASLLMIETSFADLISSSDAGVGLLSYSPLDIVITNCTFDRLSGRDGGSVYITGADRVEMTDSKFRDCVSYYGTFQRRLGTLTRVTHCLFTDNDNEYAGAYFWDAIDTTVYRSTFVNNVARGMWAGGVYVGGSASNVLVDECLFIRNAAGMGGAGMLQHSGTLRTNNTDFCMNLGVNHNSNPPSIAQDCTTCTFEEQSCCPGPEIVDRVSDHSANCICPLSDAEGTCVYECPPYQNLTDNGMCLWNPDPWVLPTGGNEIGLCAESSPCTMAYAYSIVRPDQTLNLAAGTFTSGLDITASAPVNVVGNSSDARDVVFNGVMIQLGTIANPLGSNITIENIFFLNVGTDMEARFILALTLTLRNVIFEGTSGAGSMRGAVVLASSGTLLLDSCAFLNSAKRAVNIQASDAHLVMTNCTMADITQTGSGTVIRSSGSSSVTISAQNCTFTNLNAGVTGGAIYALTFSQVTIVDCQFVSCSAATGFGGAIAGDGGTNMIVSRSTFSSNSADSISGGAIYLTSWTSSRVEDCDFNANSADRGSAIAFTSGTHDVSRCSFVGNFADSQGALWANSATVNVDNCVWCNNLANFPNSYPSTLATDCVTCQIDQPSCCDPLMSVQRDSGKIASCECDHYVTDGVCLSDCPLGYYDNDLRECSPCSDFNGTVACTECTVAGCANAGCDQYLSSDTPPLCDIDCKPDEYKHSDMTCQPCTDYGVDCTQCNRTWGCMNAGCTGVIGYTIPHQCQNSCPTDEYDQLDGTCGDCDLSFGLAGPGTDTCTSCTNDGCENLGCDGILSTDTKPLCLSGCPTHEYHFGDGTCHDCDADWGSESSANCSACSLVAGCTTCDSLFSTDTPPHCIAACPAGEYADGTQCKPCSDFDNGGSCSECSLSTGCTLDGCSGMWSNETVHKCLNECPADGYNATVDTCGDCDMSFGLAGPGSSFCDRCTIAGCDNLGCGGWLSLGSPTYCLNECPAEQYDKSDGECHSCQTDFGSESTCTVCDETDGCTDCPQIFSMNAPHQCLLSCPAIQYPLNTSYCSLCTDFGDACTSCNRSSGCFIAGCPTSISLDIPAQCIDECPSDQYDLGGKCQLCDPLCLTCTGSASGCTSCKAATYPRYGSKCEAQCHPGCLVGTCFAGPAGNGSCTCSSPAICGDKCDKMYDKCDVCGGNGVCDKNDDGATDLLTDLGPEGQAAIVGVGFLLLLVLMLVVALLVLRARMIKQRRQKIVSATMYGTTGNQSGTETLGTTMGIVSNDSGDMSLDAGTTIGAMEGTLDLDASVDDTGATWRTEDSSV